MDHVRRIIEQHQTSPLFVTYDHADIPPFPCMTRHDVAGLRIVIITYSISKIDFKSSHKNPIPTAKNHALEPEIITSKTIIEFFQNSYEIQKLRFKTQIIQRQQHLCSADTSSNPLNLLPGKTVLFSEMAW